LIVALGLAVSVVTSGYAAGSESTSIQKAAAYFSDKVGGCWTIPAAGGPVVTRVQISFNRDGSLAGPPKVLNPAQTPQDRRFNDSAVRAIVRCAPFTGLTAFGSSYQVWREMVVTFDPREISYDAQPK
jgi:hypothetical protein